MKASDVFVVLWVFVVSIARAVKYETLGANDVKQIALEANRVAESVGDQLGALDKPVGSQRR